MPQKYANAARATLASGISDSATSITLTTGEGAAFPVANAGAVTVSSTMGTDWFKCVLDDGSAIEVVYVRSHSGGADSFTNVLRGQDGTTAVAWSAGAVIGLRVVADDMARTLTGAREVLTAARTYYVRSDGSDGNSGLVDSSAGAFLTIAKATAVAATLDVGTHQLTIKVGNATWNENVSLPWYAGTTMPILEGNTATPASCFVNPSGGGRCIDNPSGRRWAVKGFKVATASGAGYGISAQNAGSYIEYGQMDFGACFLIQVAALNGGQCSAAANYSITGAAAYHWYSFDVGSLVSVASRTITITGTPAFSSAFAYAARSAWVYAVSNTYSGSATGKRYDVVKLGVIDTNVAATLPGNVAGTFATDGKYY